MRYGDLPTQRAGAEPHGRAINLDFLRSTRGRSGAPRLPGFWTVVFPWNSLDSLVRNEPFQWVASEAGRFLFLGGTFPSACVARGGRLRSEGRLGERWIMAVDVAGVRFSIETSLTPPSLFCKQLSIRRHFMKIFLAPIPWRTRWLARLTASGGAAIGLRSSPSSSAGLSTATAPPEQGAFRPPRSVDFERSPQCCPWFAGCPGGSSRPRP